MPGSGRPRDDIQTGLRNSADSGRSMISQGLGLRIVNDRNWPQTSLGLEAPLPQLVTTHSAQSNLPAQDFAGQALLNRSLSASPTRLSQRLLQNVSVEKAALRDLQSSLKQLKDCLEARVPQRRSLPPEAAIALHARDVRDLFAFLAKAEDECVKLHEIAESQEDLLGKGIQRRSPEVRLSPRFPEGTEKSLERGVSPSIRGRSQDALQEMHAELIALHKAQKELAGLKEKLEDAERGQRHRLKAGMEPDPDISEEITELQEDIDTQKEKIDRLEQSVGHFQEILDGQEDDLPSETSSLSGRADSERINNWRTVASTAEED